MADLPVVTEIRIPASRIHVVASEDGPEKGFDVQVFGISGDLAMVLHAWALPKKPIRLHLDDESCVAAGVEVEDEVLGG